jgi:hypothetical protein
MNYLVLVRLAVLISQVDSFAAQIINKGQKDQFLKDPAGFVAKRLSVGELIKSLG